MARAHSPLGQEIERLSREIEASPGDARLALRRGELYRLEGRWDLARADYDLAARRDPSLADVTLCRAALLLDEGKPAGALAAVDDYLSRERETAEARRMRARALEGLGRTRDAADDVGRAIALVGTPQPDFYLERARLLVASGDDGARAEAIKTLDDGIARLGPLVSLEERAIDLELAAGRPQAALARLDRIGGQLERKDAWSEERARILAAVATSAADPGPVKARAARVTATATATIRVVPRSPKTTATAGAAGTVAPPAPKTAPAPQMATALLAAVTRGPYLQLGTPTSVVVRWRTDVATDSRVSYGTTVGELYQFVDDPTITTEHVVTVPGLSPDTKYFYMVGTTSVGLVGDDAGTFVLTPPSGGTGKSTRIWILGDSGGANQPARDVRDAYQQYTGTRDTDLWLMLGDNAYTTGTDAEYQAAVFDMYPAMLRKSVLWPTRGNHDQLHDGDNNDYYDIFSMPTAAEAGGVASGTEAYYSFDYGDIHFVCLDSEGSDRSASGGMMTWLRSDVAATARKWVIAFWHHPPYSHGSHNSDDPFESGGRLREMRENALPILDSLGIDLVLTGHSHGYERSFLLDGHYGDSSTLVPSMIVDGGDGREASDGAYAKPSPARGPHEGTVYAVAGSSSQIGGGTYDHPVMVVSLALYGSMVIDVNGNRLDARFLTSGGAVQDSFTVIKGTAVAVGGPGVGGAALEIGPPNPNPFTTETRVSFTLPSPGLVKYSVHDPSGRRIATVLSEPMSAGPHSGAWNGRDDRGVPVPPGAYFGRLEFGGQTRTWKMLLVR